VGSEPQPDLDATDDPLKTSGFRASTGWPRPCERTPTWRSSCPGSLRLRSVRSRFRSQSCPGPPGAARTSSGAGSSPCARSSSVERCASPTRRPPPRTSSRTRSSARWSSSRATSRAPTFERGCTRSSSACSSRGAAGRGVSARRSAGSGPTPVRGPRRRRWPPPWSRSRRACSGRSTRFPPPSARWWSSSTWRRCPTAMPPTASACRWGRSW